mmetsp:Transcript_54829/g.169780  ORF Transcript_54829/g.169780 Transcript_54829/m.169780 type:complete len:341 (-) Transcript_54829:85-1107(-)
MTAAAAGWSFVAGAWSPASMAAACTPLERPLRVATLNVLFDSRDPASPCSALPEVLRHEERYSRVLEELREVDADLIALNEVTACFLRKLTEEAWVRERYVVSAVAAEAACAGLACVASFGNVLLSRVPLVSLDHVALPENKREAVVAALNLDCGRGPPLAMAVASVHLTAFPMVKEAQRARELGALTAALPAADVRLVLGDFNFHREAESGSIPAGWTELPGAQDAKSWDMSRNLLIQHYLPRVWWGAVFQPFAMRLDRAIVSGGGGGEGGDDTAASGVRVDLEASAVRLFADRPVDAAAVGRAPLGPLGLLRSHRHARWEQYLFPSDHFGLVVDLALA